MAGGAAGGMDAASGLGTVGLPASVGMGAADSGAVNAAAMAPWQRGLMALTTGNPQYGQNAPAMNQMLKGSIGQMMGPQQRPMGAAPMMRPQMGAPPSMTQITGAQMQPMGPMPFQQMQGQMPQMQQQSIAPWMMGARMM